MVTSSPSTPLSTLSEEEVVTWSEEQLLQACVHYNFVVPAPLPTGVALRVFFLHHLRAARAACVGTAQDGGGSPRLPPPPAKTPPPGSEAQGDDPTVPFGYGAIGHPHPEFPPPSRNLAKEFEEADQFARDDPLYRQDVMDSLREAAAMLPVVVPYGGAPGDAQPGYHSSPCSFDEESMGVSSPPRPKPKRTRADRSPQLEHMCRPRTRQIPGCSPAHLRRAGPGSDAGLPSPRGVPNANRSAPPEDDELRSTRAIAQDQVRRAPSPRDERGQDNQAGRRASPAGIERRTTEEMAREKRAQAPDQPGGAADGVDGATAGAGDEFANAAAEGPEPFPLLSTDQWHLLVRLPDRPREEDLHHLPGAVLVALLRANGICCPEGCTHADAWAAIARWLAQHPELPLALPLGRLRLAPSPQRGRRSARHRRAPSYDGMIESEGASAVTLSPSDGPSERDHASPTAGVPRGPTAAPRRTLGCRQSELLRKLPPAPSAAHLQGLSIDALRELLRANDVVMKPRTRKAKLRNAVLNLVAEPGSTVRLPDGLCRASEGVPVDPAISHDEGGLGDAAPRRTHDDAPGRAAHNSQPAGADRSNGSPNGGPQCPLRAHGAPLAAPGLAAELPAMPHCAPAYPADPDCGKLSAAVIAALEGLPLRPSAEQLRGTKFAGLQTLLKMNGLPRPSNASVESMTDQLCAWLA